MSPTVSNVSQEYSAGDAQIKPKIGYHVPDNRAQDKYAAAAVPWVPNNFATSGPPNCAQVSKPKTRY